LIGVLMPFPTNGVVARGVDFALKPSDLKESHMNKIIIAT